VGGTTSRYVWFPSEELKLQSNWMDFMRAAHVASYEELLTRADADPAWFNDAVIRWSGFRFTEPYERVLDLSQGIARAQWCVGATTNLVLTCLQRNIEEGRGAKTAIHWQAEDGHERAWTYDDLMTETQRMADALLGLGLGRGDVIGLYMPLMPEAAAAMFAVAWIGGIVMPLFSGFGADAIAARLNDGEAKAVITVDGTYRRGEAIAMKPVLDEALAKVPSVAHVVVVPRLNSQIDMKRGRDHWLAELARRADAPSRPVELPADTQFMLVYTSGTTGKPKGTIHTHISLPLKAVVDFQLCFDLKVSDRFMWMSDMGWLIGPLEIMATTLAGGTLIMAEGAVDYPGPDRLWQIIEKHKISVLGLGPALARVLMRHGEEIPSRFDLSSIRIVPSSGEPWDDTSWQWVFDNVCRRRAPLMNWTGGTEMGGGIVSTNILYPIKPGSFHGQVPGTGGDILDEQGKPVPPNVRGELVMTRPCIGLTRSMWRADDRYMEYWSHIPDTWVHGDWASRDDDGVWYIHGRSDDTLKINGQRTGPAEIESTLMATGRVSDVAVIGVPEPDAGTVVVIAVVPTVGEAGSAALAADLTRAVVDGHGDPFRPKRVLFVAELPKTRNMKTMRRVIRAAITSESPGDLTALVNPETFEALKAAAGASKQ
jgi:acetyl-CoA synthetase